MSGFLATYVDETLACGSRTFPKLSEKTRKRFDVKHENTKKCVSLEYIYTNVQTGLMYTNVLISTGYSLYLSTLISCNFEEPRLNYLGSYIHARTLA